MNKISLQTTGYHCFFLLCVFTDDISPGLYTLRIYYFEQKLTSIKIGQWFILGTLELDY